MADNAQLNLPGKFEKGKKYLLSGETLSAWQRALKEDRAIAGPGLKENQSPQGRTFSLIAGMGFRHAFQISVKASGGALTWSVSSFLSTITDGTNGTAIDISSASFDTATSIATTKFIVLEADVDSTLALTNWTLSAVDLADTAEVVMSGSIPDEQTKIRLYIGKITIAAGVATVTQAITSAQRVANDMTNGVLTKVFEFAPTAAA